MYSAISQESTAADALLGPWQNNLRKTSIPISHFSVKISLVPAPDLINWRLGWLD